MSDSAVKPWSNNPNAPQITFRVYIAEKENFAGTIIGTMLYGVVIILFFQCIVALFNPVNRTRGFMKWGLMAHTITMFSFATVFTATNLNLQFVSYINDREYPTGPLGYQRVTQSNAASTVSTIAFCLTTWLADGLLLYRCYVIYAMNFWVVAFPCLMYLASLVVGIVFLYTASHPEFVGYRIIVGADIIISSFLISLSLNVILTLMIATRLVLHGRNVQNATGGRDGVTRLYKAIVTMLIESCALYTVCLILWVGPYRAGSSIQFITWPVVGETQVIAPFLIVLRVANRTALTSDTVVSGNVGSIHFRSHGKSTDEGGTLPDGNTVASTDARGETPGELGDAIGATIDEVPL